MSLKITIQVAAIRRTSQCIFLTGHDAEGRWRECRFKPDCSWLESLRSAWIEVTGRPGIAWVDRWDRVVLVLHSDVAKRAPRPAAVADAGPVPKPRHTLATRRARVAPRNAIRTKTVCPSRSRTL